MQVWYNSFIYNCTFFMIELFFKDFLELFWQNPIWQCFWFLWMGILLYGFMQSDDTKTRKILCFASVAWMTHYFLMGLTSAAVAALIWFIRLILSLKFHKNIFIFFWVVSITSFYWFVSFDTPLWLLPIVNSILGTIGFFFLEKIRFRILVLCISFSWLFYAVSVWSLWGMINEVLLQFILIMVIIRMAGKEWHIHHYRDKIHNILHKRPAIDMWELVVLKDRDKLIRKHGYLWKLTHVLSKKKHTKFDI